MKNFKLFHTSRGFSMIEVLISVVILGFGLLALAALQTTIIRSSSESKAQTIALGLAKDKVEELRNYSILNEASNAVACPQVIRSYQCITGSGAAETITEGGVSFSRTWIVSRYVASGSVFSLNGSNTEFYTGSTPRNEFKSINVTVTWTAANTQAQFVTLKDAIGAIQPSDTSRAQNPIVGSSPRPAIARITDPGLIEGVIPIAVGDGTNSAATNPKPELVVGQSVVETRFDVLTYAGLSGGSANVQARVETVMTGCKCDTATKSASTVRGYRPTYWNGTRYAVPEFVATATPGYSPLAGEDASTTQSPLCRICCRDHVDPVGTDTALFSPYRAVRNGSGIVTTAHPHYNSSAVGSPVVTAGKFSEACRLIRVDGIFRVATDLNNDYFGLLATEDLQTPANNASSAVPDNYAIKRYQGFVVDYINERYTNSTTSTYNVPSATNATLLEGPRVVTLNAVDQTVDLNQPSSIDITAPIQVKTLHTRALYFDFLEQEAIDAITNAKASCPSQSGSVLSNCVLKKLPFTSINLTEIANWNSVNPDPIVVTNNDANATGVKRAKVTATSSAQNTPATIYTKAGKSNSGLLDLSFDAISPDDAIKWQDTQAFRVNPNGSVPPGPNDGTFYANLTMPTGFVGTAAVYSIRTGLPAQSCTVGSPVTNNTCSVNFTVVGNGLGVDNGMAVDVTAYNRATAVQQTSPSIANCTGTGNATGFSIRNSGIAPYTVNTCTNYAVQSSTNTNTGEVLTVPSARITKIFDGLQTETTRLSFTRINNGNIISVIFDPSSIVTTLTPSSTGGTCTFTCSGLNNSGNDCNASGPAFTIVAPICP